MPRNLAGIAEPSPVAARQSYPRKKFSLASAQLSKPRKIAIRRLSSLQSTMACDNFRHVLVNIVPVSDTPCARQRVDVYMESHGRKGCAMLVK